MTFPAWPENRRSLRHLTALVIAVSGIIAVANPALPAAKPAEANKGSASVVSGPGPNVKAASAILIDQTDGKVLWEKDSNRKRAIASITKILTALVVIEHTKPDDTVAISEAAQKVGDGDPLVTQLNLTVGEKLTVEQLLYGLLLPSANDAAVALAERVGGSVPGFVKLMNAKAAQLGARDSHFVNSNGLDDPNHYSTGGDMAQIARAAMQSSLFRKIVATEVYKIPWAGHPEGRVVRNRNQLLGHFAGATGIKTGQTLAAGHCLVSSSSRGGEDRIAVVLDSPDPVADSEALLSFGFTGFRRFQIANRSRAWGQVTYGDGTTVNLVPVRDASLLLHQSTPDPRVIYDVRRRALIALGTPSLTVPVKIRCRISPCVDAQSRGDGLVAGFLSLLGPLLSLAR